MSNNIQNEIDKIKNNCKKKIDNEKKADINLYFTKTLNNTISAFLLSLITTLINFICNIPLLRHISKESYGLVKIHFELAFTLVNYIPRETIRRSSQKFCPDKDPKKEEEKYYMICQINFLIFLLIFIFSIIIFFCFIFLTDSNLLHKNYFQLIIYIICSLIELLIEPIILYMNLHMENKFVPITISSLSRVVSNTILVSFFNMDLWSFTISRIIGTSVYLSYIIFLGFFKYKLQFKRFIPKNYKSLIFKKATKKGINLSYLREIYFQFIKLNILNFILLRCQNLNLSFILKCSNEEKSDYSFISQNYSLISRFLFEPIIDAFYNLVNKIKNININDCKYIIKEKLYSFQNINEKIKIIIDNKANKKIENIEGNRIINVFENNINYFIVIELFQLFLKIFAFIGILIIPYYLIIGTEFIGFIYGIKWENNNIDKIGDCFSFYVILSSILDLIRSFGNAINDKNQMKLVNISLIINSFILSIFMYILSKWDICGLLIANDISSLFLINANLYIIFCGRLNNSIYPTSSHKLSIFSDIKNNLEKCFVSKNSFISTSIFIVLGHIIKKNFLFDRGNLVKLIIIFLIGLINIATLFLFEYKIFIKQINKMKSYK